MYRETKLFNVSLFHIVLIHFVLIFAPVKQQVSFFFFFFEVNGYNFSKSCLIFVLLSNFFEVTEITVVLARS